MGNISGAGNLFAFKRRLALRKNEKGVLADASPEMLIDLAKKYGINFKKFDEFDLKEKIYRKIATIKRETEIFNIRSSRLEGKGKYNEKLELKRKALGVFSDNAGLFNNGGISGSSSTLVSFDSNGNLQNKEILSANAVYIVGTGAAGTFEKTFSKKRIARES